MSLANSFVKEGTIPVEGNKPVLLTDPGSVWFVAGGKLAVFSVPLEDNRPMGSRHYLFDAREGDLLFGIGDPEEKTGLLAAGLTGTSLGRLTLENFYQLARGEESGNQILALVNGWLKALAGALDLKESPGAHFDPSGGGLLVTGATEDGTEMTLGSYHSLALSRAVSLRQSREQEDTDRIQARVENDRAFMDTAIARLVSVTERKKKGEHPEDTTEDPLFQACLRVGSMMKMRIVPLPPAIRENPSKDPLGDIARVSRFRTRQVALKGEWWRRDNGPLLAYMEEDGRPVALIPLSPSDYELYDPTGRKGVKIDAGVAGGVKPFAFSFYRPFPDKVMTIKDLLLFSVESTWKRDLSMILIMGLLGGLLGMVVPVATGIVFDTVIPGGERAQLLQIAFFLGTVAFAEMIFQLTRSFAMLRVQGKMEGCTQAAVWDRLLSLPVPFFKQFSAGELAMRALGISAIYSLLSGISITTILSTIFSIFNLGLIFYYDVKLAFIATAITAVALVIMLSLSYAQIRYERLLVDISNKISGMVLQLIGGIAKFKVAGAEKRAFYRWSGEFNRERTIAFKKENIANHLNTFNALFPVIASMILFYTVASATGSTLSPGKFIAFNSAFTTFLTAMVALSQSFMVVNMIVPLYEKAKPILETMPEYSEAKADPGTLSGDIEVSHLCFRYREDGPLALDDVSLHISEGEYVGLVGPSGSGKSTLFRVLLGFERPQSGSVYYNGHDMDKVDIRSLRRQLGVVLQNGKLMAGDIFTNIVGSNPNLTLDDAMEAAKMAGLDKDIEDMPMGMHTVISEGAGTFSGGQRQRLLIARAIVSRPKILFFDEATSALDNRTQAIVSQSLDSLRATRVVIAHRLSTILNCDRIVVMDKGRIVEEGTYAELMDRNGVFTELARRQLA